MSETIPFPETLLELPKQFYWPRAESVKSPWNINCVVVAAHPSGARSVLPLVDQLVKHGSECTLITPPAKNKQERAATTFAKKYKFVRPPEPRSASITSEILSPNKVNLVVFTASGGGDETLEIDTIKEAIKWKKGKNQVLIVGVEGEASELVGTIKLLKESGIHPESEIDALFLANRLAAASYQNENFPTQKLIPTGPTGFDFLRRENTQELAETFRRNNGIAPNDTVIVYNAIRGTGLWSEIEIDATPKILSAVFSLANRYPDKKFVFIYRFHPDDQKPEVLNEILDGHSKQPKNLMLIVHQPQETKNDSRSPLAAADLAITTVSTTNTGVALCGAKPESVRPQTGHMPLYYISSIARDELEKTGTILPTASQLQAAATANVEQELLPTMEDALFDVDYRRRIFSAQAAALRDIYRFRGIETATDRTILQIRRILKTFKK